MATSTLSRSCIQLASCSRSSAVARMFLALEPSSRRTIHYTPLPPVLDFLLPKLRTTRPSARFENTTSLRNRSNVQSTKAVRRSFTTSGRRQHSTAAIHNPQKDDDGNDMSIEITPRASKRLKEIMTKDQNPNLALRIQVESGGCHGFQYLMSLTTLPPLSKSSSTEIREESPPALNTSSADPNEISSTTTGKVTEKVSELEEDDTVFGISEDGPAGAKVVMNTPSLELLKGSKVDYTMELIGSQFKIVDNPLASSNCGCGTSFDIKF